MQATSESDPTLMGSHIATPGTSSGPGVVLLPDPSGSRDHLVGLANLLAAEGYVVLVPDPGALEAATGPASAPATTAAAVGQLRDHPQHVGQVGVVAFGSSADAVPAALGASPGVACAVLFEPVDLAATSAGLAGVATPVTVHVAGTDDTDPGLPDHGTVEVFRYPLAADGFLHPTSPTHDPMSADLAYTRTISALRSTMGPHYDLSALWDEHLMLEFAVKDAGATMATMVDEPYVNHIPTITGGTGFEMLARFYEYHFIHENAEQKIIPISRTIGVNRVVDEFVACFTHDREISWLLPGVPATGRHVELPVVSVVGFRGGKLHHEHIYWDQATLLVQIGLLDADGDLPVAGVETARKLLDESLPSNELMKNWATSEGKPIPARPRR